MEKARDWEQKLLVNEVIEGLESSKELRIHLDMSSPAGLLVKKIQSSLTNALSMLKSSGEEEELPLTGPKASSSSTLDINKSPQIEDSDQASNDMGDLVHFLKRRKPSMETKQMRVVCSETDPPDDGYSWRKHGQKEITGSTFPRTHNEEEALELCLWLFQLQLESNVNASWSPIPWCMQIVKKL